MILVVIVGVVPVLLAWLVGRAMSPIREEPQEQVSCSRVRSYDRFGNLLFDRPARKVDVYR